MIWIRYNCEGQIKSVRIPERNEINVVGKYASKKKNTFSIYLFCFGIDIDENMRRFKFGEIVVSTSTEDYNFGIVVLR